MKRPSRDAQIAALSDRVQLETTHTIWCQRKNLGCQTSGWHVTNRETTPEQAARAFYRAGWRIREHGGHLITSGSNCFYSDKRVW